MKRAFLKQNKGVSLMDITIAVVILCIFIGVIGNIYYLIVSNNGKISANAIATYYSVKLAEDIDKLSYGEVTKQNLEARLTDANGYDYPDAYEMTVEVENYNSRENVENDIIKIVTIKMKYNIFNEEITYNLQKLKIKERAI